MQIINKPIGELKPYENNPRINDKAVDAVAASIKEFGFKQPCVIDTDNVLICGHTRLKAAQKLGLSEIPCILADDLTDDQIKAFRLADNKTAELAEWDFSLLDIELADIDLDMSEFGFDEKIDPDDFDDEFTLPDGDKSEFQTMTFTLHEKQVEIIKAAMAAVETFTETYGNTNSNGNAIAEVCKEWAEQKKLL